MRWDSNALWRSIFTLLVSNFDRVDAELLQERSTKNHVARSNFDTRLFMQLSLIVFFGVNGVLMETLISLPSTAVRLDN